LQLIGRAVADPYRAGAAIALEVVENLFFEVSGEYFDTLPARSTVKVAELLMGARVDIEALAIRRFCL
jgi:enamine deaminase RidA (YjgF/YER057c/UK114 family)